MRRFVLTSVSLFVCATLLWLIARPTGPQRSRMLPEAAAALRALHAPPPVPQPGDWLEGPGRHEPGQTYDAWRVSMPVRATGARRVLYVVRIGAVGAAHREIIAEATAFLGAYYALPVRSLPPIENPGAWPATTRRDRGAALPQLDSQWILEHALAPRLPDDAAALLAFTTHDLWPGDDWNFVFGQASLQRRVGVWSLARFGDPGAGPEARLRCLRRTLQVACHETGHMFSFDHCRAHACVMAGANSLAESDRQPLWLCPECLPKAWDATGADPAARFSDLAARCRALGLDAEADFYEASLRALASVSR